MEITPTSANVMEYAAIVRDKALLRGCGPGGLGDHRHGAGGRGRGLTRFWRRRSRRSTPSAGARAPRTWCPLRQVLPEVLDRLGGDERERGPPAGPLHGPVRRGPEDHGPEQIGPDPAGGPARHGQDLLGAERGAERGQGLQQDRGRLLPGDVPGAAGHPAFVLRGAGGEQPAQHRRPAGDGLGEDRRRRHRPEPGGYPHRRQPACCRWRT